MDGGSVVITVECSECARKIGRLTTSEFPDNEGAAAFIRRHHAFTGHRAEITEEQQ